LEPFSSTLPPASKEIRNIPNTTIVCTLVAIMSRRITGTLHNFETDLISKLNFEMVERKEGKAAEMVSALSANYRWCVTGIIEL